MGYELHVYGYLWDWTFQRPTVYTYPLCKPVTTDAEAKQAAGDFSALLDWRLVEHRHEYHREGRTRVHRHITRTLRGFRNGMTPKRFANLAG